MLLVILGLYYNGAPTLWLAYSTFAGKFFAAHCVNPTKPCCKGQCQVKAIEEHSGSSENSQTKVEFAAPEPTVLSVYYLPEPQQEVQPNTENAYYLPADIARCRPFHPPKV